MNGWINELIGYSAGATFVWLALIVLIEGDRHGLVTWSLALTMLICAGLALSLFGRWSLVLDVQRMVAIRRALQAIAAGTWCGVALLHTQLALSPQQWRWLRGLLVCFSLWASTQLVLSGTRPEFVASSNILSAIFFSRIGPPLLLLALSGTVFWLAQRGYDRLGGTYRPRQGLLTHFLPASVFAMIAFVAIELLNIASLQAAPTRLDTINTSAQVAIGTLFIFGALVLDAMRTNRQLLGRPIRTRDLFARWGLLIGLLASLYLLIWLGTFDFWVAALASTMLATAIVALIEWLIHHMYGRVHGRVRRLLHDSLTGWPRADPDVCRDQAKRIFKAMAKELEADACYLQLQLGPHMPPVIHNHKWTDEPPTTRDRGIYDWVTLRVDDIELGYVALRGPGGSAYSRRDLELVEQTAYTIANLHWYSRQAETFEQVVVQRRQAQHQRDHTLQRLLHDFVGGNLDSIHKATRLISAPNDEWVTEIREAARESMVLIRNLLRAELTPTTPLSLASEGIVTAIRSDLFARIRQQYGSHMTLSLDVAEAEAIILASWLTNERLRTVYEAIEELVRNAARHGGSHAFTISIRLRCDENGLLAEVIDTGVGFAPALTDTASGVGLRYHQAALRLIDGVLDIYSTPGGGVHARIHLPRRLIQHPQIAHSKIEWHRIILEVDKHLGGRLLINDDPSDLTRTPELLVQMLLNRGLTEEEILERQAIDLQRQAIFKRYLTTYDYKELVDRKRLERYIWTGQTDEGKPGLSLELAHAHVHSIIDLLRTYEHYHLALHDQPTPSNFAVKPGYAVLWETRSPNGDGRFDDYLNGICDIEPGVVSQFTRRFEEAWQAVPAHLREKAQVIAWLERQLSEAQARQQERQVKVPQNVTLAPDLLM